jgi:hypothetical protein
MTKISWHNAVAIESRSYVCGYCGHSLASQFGYIGGSHPYPSSYIYICHYCFKPTFFDAVSKQTPGPIFGQPIKHIADKNVESLYNEARTCYTINAFTSSVMCCRKLLMNISVSEGAEAGKSFVEYVNYLNENNYIPPKGKDWVDQIRKLGNDANHSIEFNTEEQSRLILIFTEMLLKFIYELPGLLGGASDRGV